MNGDLDWIPDPGSDFRDGLDGNELDYTADDFRLDFSPAPKKQTPASKKLTREQINAKKRFRLPPDVRAHLIFELLTTNKSFSAIAREFGVSPQAVYSLFSTLSKSPRIRLLYTKDGAPYWTFKSKQNELEKENKHLRAAIERLKNCVATTNEQGQARTGMDEN